MCGRRQWCGFADETKSVLSMKKMVLPMCDTRAKPFKSGCEVMAKTMPITNMLGKRLDKSVFK